MFRENYETNLNLTPYQRVYKNEYDRDGVAKIRKGLIPRKYVSLVAFPSKQSREISYSNDPTVEHFKEKLTEESTFVYNKKIDIVSLCDQFRHDNQGNKGGRNIQALVLTQIGQLQKNGLVKIGGDPDSTKLVLDFNKKPVQPYQPSLQVTENRRILWPVNGPGLIQKTDTGYNFCVGKLKIRGCKKGGVPAVAFHLPNSAFEGDSPAVSTVGIAELPEEVGEEVAIGLVSGNSIVIEVHRPVRFEKTLRSRGRFTLIKPRGLQMMSSNLELFIVLNRLNKIHNDLVLEPELPYLTEDELIGVCPSKWIWKPMIEFDEQRFKQGISSVGFKPNEELAGRILYDVGPEGSYNISRLRPGEVETSTVNCDGKDSVEVSYADGSRQVLPPSAVVDINNLQIGQYCPRKAYTWSEFEGLMGDFLVPFLRDYLVSIAVNSGKANWEGPGILLDARYCQSLLHFANRDSHNEVKWYWDFRNALRYLNKETGSLICPPIHFDNADPVLNLATMSVNLAFPRKANKQAGQARRQSVTSMV